MDIIVAEKSLRNFLKTDVKIGKIIDSLCNSGPTVDRFHKSKGDTVMEIEIITNRIDSASVFGVAREANAILNQNNIKSSLTNSPYLHNIKTHETKTEKLNFKISDTKLVKRFTAVSINNVNVKDSPKAICELLESTGQRPINNLVDATNEATLLYGIPSHVFDKDKLNLQSLNIRESKKGEILYTLDDTKIILQEGDIVIEDGSGQIVDLCGVMGGQAAVVDNHTKNIILIVPIYNPQKIRKTSLFHQKRTLAAQIYEKSPDTEICLEVLDLIANNISERAGGKVSSKVFDFQTAKPKPKTVSLKLSWLNTFAGIKIGKQEVLSILKNLGFTETKILEETLSTTVPSFRDNDINTREDLAEEIIRVYGYYKIPSSLPPLNKTPKPTSNIFSLERKIKSILVTSGYNEIYNSSLISQKLIESTDLNPTDHLKLKNCLSEDLEYLRTSLVPSAIQNHLNNKGKSKLDNNFFELSNVYLPVANQALPSEISSLIISSSKNILGLKSDLEKLFNLLNFTDYEFVQPSKSKQAYLSDKNSADIFINKTLIGKIGEVKTLISKSLGILNIISVAELNIEALNTLIPNQKYTPISEYPSLNMDITITSSKPIGEIIKQIYKLDSNIKSILYKDTYKTNKTFEIIIESLTQNLTQQDADKIRENIQNKFNTEI